MQKNKEYLDGNDIATYHMLLTSDNFSVQLKQGFTLLEVRTTS